VPEEQGMRHRALYCLSVVLLFLSLCGPPPVRAQDPGPRLVGTAVAEDPGESIAVIEDPASGKQRIYREGARLGKGLIKKILFGKVIVETRAGEEVLVVGRGSSQPWPGQPGRLEREEVESSIPDYTHLMEQIRVRPKFEGGQPRGFVIYNIGPGSIFEKMGLQDGDIIVSVNGRAFETTQPVVEFYDALMKGETVSLEVNREGSPQRLLFEIR